MSTPSQGQIGYEVLDRTTGAHKATLAVAGDPIPDSPIITGPEPVFGGDINVGTRALVVRFGVDPDTVMAPMDLVRVTLPDGTYMGKWKYEKKARDTSRTDAWDATLMPLAEELQSTDFTANYSNVATVPASTLLGPVAFSVPVNTALQQTRHCHAATVTNDGDSGYAMQFQAPTARVLETLNKAIAIGGVDWWWYCDGDGAVQMQNVPRTTYTIQRVRNHILYEQPVSDMQPVVNVQPVTGGSPPDAFGFNTTIRSTATQTTGVYGVTAIGRRIGQPWSDNTIMNQRTLDKLASSILARSQIKGDTTIIRLGNVPQNGFILPRFQSGDKVRIQEAGGALGPYLWVVSTREEGSTGVQTLTCAAQMGAYHSSPGAGFAQGFASTASTIAGVSNSSPGSTSGGGGSGQIPFIHLANSSHSGTGNSTFSSTAFILDSNVGLLLRGVAQIDHAGAAGTYTLAILSSTNVVLASETRGVDANGQCTIVLLTDAPLGNGTYTLQLSVAVSGAWAVTEDQQLDLFC